MYGKKGFITIFYFIRISTSNYFTDYLFTGLFASALLNSDFIDSLLELCLGLRLWKPIACFCQIYRVNDELSFNLKSSSLVKFVAIEDVYTNLLDEMPEERGSSIDL